MDAPAELYRATWVDPDTMLTHENISTNAALAIEGLCDKCSTDHELLDPHDDSIVCVKYALAPIRTNRYEVENVETMVYDAIMSTEGVISLATGIGVLEAVKLRIWEEAHDNE